MIIWDDTPTDFGGSVLDEVANYQAVSELEHRLLAQATALTIAVTAGITEQALRGPRDLMKEARAMVNGESHQRPSVAHLRELMGHIERRDLAIKQLGQGQ